MDYNYISHSIFTEREENLRRLAELFPAVVKDKQVDFAALREELGQFEEVGTEKYELMWSGKQAAKRAAQSDVAGRTLKYVPEDCKDADTTQNLYIEGDNLEVLKLLRQNYYGAVKMVYIDPPYNLDGDYIYRDNWTISKAESDEAEGEIVDGERMIVNQKSSNRYHATWLNMIYPRLRVAKDLLSDDGVIFISCDNAEVENLKKICNEIYGDSSFVDCITWNTRVPKNDNKGIGNIHQYILVYVKQSETNRQFMMPKDGLDEVFELLDKMKKQRTPIPKAEEELKKLYNKKGYDRGITLYNALDDNYEPWGKINMSWPNGETFGPNYDILHPITKKPTKKPDRGWRWNRETFDSHLDYEHVLERHDGSYVCGDIWFAKDENTQPSSIKYLRDVGKMLLRSIVSLKSDGGVELEGIFDGKSFFSYPKPTSLMRLLVDSLIENQGVYLDFFSGSATTAHAIMQLNAEDGGKRRFIMVQYPEICAEGTEAEKAGYANICQIGKERIRRAGEKIKSEIEARNARLKIGEEPKQMPDIGFKVLRTTDTNIRWTHEALKPGQITLDYSQITDKEKLDFMPGFTDIDVAYEILLRQRDIPLSAKVEKLGIGERTYMFADAYVICLDDKVTKEMVGALAAIEPTPIKYVFRDSAFDDDISFKDETIRRLEAYIARNNGENKKAYTVEFI